MTSTSPASMGGPLSEADRLAGICRRLKMAKVATANAPGTFWHTFTENTEFLLSRVGVLEGQLATARAMGFDPAEEPVHHVENHPGNASPERADCPGCGKRIVIRKNGTYWHHREDKSGWYRAPLCKFSGTPVNTAALGLDGGDPDER